MAHSSAMGGIDLSIGKRISKLSPIRRDHIGGRGRRRACRATDSKSPPYEQTDLTEVSETHVNSPNSDHDSDAEGEEASDTGSKIAQNDPSYLYAHPGFDKSLISAPTNVHQRAKRVIREDSPSIYDSHVSQLISSDLLSTDNPRRQALFLPFLEEKAVKSRRWSKSAAPTPDDMRKKRRLRKKRQTEVRMARNRDETGEDEAEETWKWFHREKKNRGDI